MLRSGSGRKDKKADFTLETTTQLRIRPNFDIINFILNVFSLESQY